MALVLRSQEAASSSSSSSSSSRTNTSFRYDVFLSFRGEDTRKNFTDHLYAALKQAGIRTFRDDDEMERGRLLKPELENAIQQSAISIIVFSKNYASSRWCLDEVLTILEQRNKPFSKHEVVPVFYDVDPSDVRNQRGSFAEAFYRHYEQAEAEMDDESKKERLEKIKAWRAALREAADLTGMVLANEHEASFIYEIVCMIIKKLRRSSLQVPEYLVGIDRRIGWLDSWIKNGSTEVLVLSGIGGVGKTTTAKYIYNLNYEKFEASCFLADIRDMFNQSNGVLHLQSQLVSTVLKTQREEIIWNVHEGAFKVNAALSNKKVLIVLDDVAHERQLEELLGTLEFYPGSKIIITTRNLDIIYSLEGRCQYYAVNELDDEQSLKLFSWYAFGQHYPKETYVEQSKKIVHHCGGLPLALKVLGSSLKGRKIDVWKESLRKLEEIPNSRIQQILQVSYECLEDDNDKDLFLHIAIFFVGEDKDDVITILEQCGLYPVVGTHTLINQCLLYVQDDRIMMHQLIQEMAKDIIRKESPTEPGKRSRLWRNLDSFNVLKEKTGTSKIVGLALDMKMLTTDTSIQSTSCNADYGGKHWYHKFFGWTSSILQSQCPETRDLEIDAFERMDNLMLLQLNYVRLSGSYKKLPKRLRWLRWHGFPSTFVPAGMPFEMLVSLDMSYSKLHRVWKGFMFLASLKILNLSYSRELVETPNFAGLTNLEKLILRGCVGLVKICQSIARHKRLVLLDLQECTSLRNIPRLPTSLETLKLSGCSNLITFGRGKMWGSLPCCLVNLNISGCNLSDDSFPRDFSHLISLKYLNLARNPITILPDCVRGLPNLSGLEVTYCTQLQSLLGLPSTLKDLKAHSAESLEEISPVPDSLIYLDYPFDDSLAVLQGCLKSALVENVDRKVVKLLGLESVARVNGLDVVNGQSVSTASAPIKVWYEFGIFSAYIPGQELPTCYMFKERGSQISFKVPSHPNNSKIQGLSVCFTFTSQTTGDNLMKVFDVMNVYEVYVVVHNNTKDVKWEYRQPRTVSENIPVVGEEGKFTVSWLSLWKCGELLEAGDEVDVAIDLVPDSKHGKYIECSINLVYEDMISEENNPRKRKREEADEEEVEMLEKRKTYQLSWTDKMIVEISDYVHSGKTYLFASNVFDCFSEYGSSGSKNPGDLQLVDWLGPKPISSKRHFYGGVVTPLSVQLEIRDALLARLRERRKLRVLEL